MGTFNRLRYLAGGIVRCQLRRQSRRFRSATAKCRDVQAEVLKRLIRLNADSQFSRERRLHEVRTGEELRRRLPIADYETFRAYIDRMKLGDHGALLGRGNRLLMFSLSSGTTAESKYIPITERFVRDYRRGWQVWGIRTFDDHPGLHTKNIVQLTSDYQRFRTPDGTPCGNISGLVVAMQKPIVRYMYSVPRVVSKIHDPDAKYYTALRLAVADPHVGIVSTANPSTLVHLAKLADARKEELIRDVADGTLSRQFEVPEEVRRRLHRKLTGRRPARARELEQIVLRTGRLYPADYWPGMEVLAVWCGGSAAAYLHALKRYYGNVPIRDHGLHASEGRMTIPVEDARSAGILDVTSHYFEFIPERECESDCPTILPAHELTEGNTYFILLTTASGLYRYNICDVVRCVGFEGTTPVLEFLHKGAHIANVTGEKVSESQVVEAVRSSMERLNVHLEHFTVSPVFGEPPCYQLFVEQADLPDSTPGDVLAQDVDGALMRLNCEYCEKRTSGRLDPLRIVLLPEGTWRRFISTRQSRLGGSIEQYKHPCLVPDMNFAAEFLQTFAHPPQRTVRRPSQPRHVHVGAG